MDGITNLSVPQEQTHLVELMVYLLGLQGLRPLVCCRLTMHTEHSRLPTHCSAKCQVDVFPTHRFCFHVQRLNSSNHSTTVHFGFLQDYQKVRKRIWLPICLQRGHWAWAGPTIFFLHHLLSWLKCSGPGAKAWPTAHFSFTVKKQAPASPLKAIPFGFFHTWVSFAAWKDLSTELAPSPRTPRSIKTTTSNTGTLITDNSSPLQQGMIFLLCCQKFSFSSKIHLNCLPTINNSGCLTEIQHFVIF